MEERSKTISKHFFDDEIKYKTSSGIIYLKQGIRRFPKTFYNEWDEIEESVSLINTSAKFMDKIQRVINIRREENDYN